jgi:deoxycitidine kinase
MNNRKQIISIEGNIGAGKSTFVDIIKKNIENSEIVCEPVEMWKKIKDTDGSNILEKYYKDIPRWAYSFQNLACITRMIKIEDTIRESDAEFIFLDRSLGTDKNVFEKMLYDSKEISEIEHRMYNLWCDFYHKYIRPEFENIVIYLRCTPETSLLRIKKRGRAEEQEISLNYLTNLHKYHEEWLMDTTKTNKLNVIVIDCDADFEHDLIFQKKILNTVVEKINSIKNTSSNIKNKMILGNETLGNEISGNEISGNETLDNQISGNEISGNETLGNETLGKKLSLNELIR